MTASALPVTAPATSWTARLPSFGRALEIAGSYLLGILWILPLFYADAESPRYPAVLTAEAAARHADAALIPLLYEEAEIAVDPNAGRRDWEAEGYPFQRLPSRGANDEGDVSGPLTIVEVKIFGGRGE